MTAAALLRLDSTAATTVGPEDEASAFQALVSHLEQRIDTVLSQYPLLAHCVQSPRSRSPTWAPIVPTPTSKDILHVGPKINVTHDAEVRDMTKLLSKTLLEQQSVLSASTDLERGPLWRVQLNPVEGVCGQALPWCMVVLATEHVVNDGRGTLNLLQMLLQRAQPVPPQLTTIPPASDAIFDFKPSTGYMLGVVWQELVLPKLPLPRKITAKLRGSTSWPATASSASGGAKSDLVRPPKDCDPASHVILVSAPNLITNLKRLAQEHVEPKSGTKKAATLHAIVHTLALASLFAAIAQPRMQAKGTALDNLSLVMGTGTPISLRNEGFAAAQSKKRGLTLAPAVESARVDAPLPATTGNFVSSHVDTIEVHGGDTFWRLTNRFASNLSSLQARKVAKQRMGMLSYIPEFNKSAVGDQDEADRAPATAYANGWEKFIGDKVESATPFDAAFGVSNLGLIDVSQLGVECTEQRRWNVAVATWAQAPAPQGEAFCIDVVGLSGTPNHDQMLSVTISTRPAAFADAALHHRFYTYLNHLLLTFAAHQPDPTPPTTSQTQLDLSTDPTFASLARFLALSTHNQVAS